MPKVVINYRGRGTEAEVSFDADANEVTVDIWPVGILQELQFPDGSMGLLSGRLDRSKTERHISCPAGGPENFSAAGFETIGECDAARWVQGSASGGVLRDKACPFCGCADTRIIRDEVCCPIEYGAWLCCDDCDAGGPQAERHETPAEAEAAAIALWNARHPAPVTAHDQGAAAIATLEAMGYQHRGGVRWAPPLGDPATVSAALDLPWRIRDIQRGLILFRTSNNAHGSINFESLTSKIDALPPQAKEELADLMRVLAQSIHPAPTSAECCPCGGSGWVEDQNWSWDYPDLPQERVPGNGLIRCGLCGGPA